MSSAWFHFCFCFSAVFLHNFRYIASAAHFQSRFTSYSYSQSLPLFAQFSIQQNPLLTDFYHRKLFKWRQLLFDWRVNAPKFLGMFIEFERVLFQVQQTAVTKHRPIHLMLCTESAKKTPDWTQMTCRKMKNYRFGYFGAWNMLDAL